MEKVLIVEDMPEFQLVIRSVLQPRYSVIVASTVEEARAQLNRESVDLMILDIGLPDGDGFEFCEELKAQESTRSMPVIFLSARSELTDKLKGFSLGADDYIVKPFEALELRARVEAKLARAREQKRPNEAIVMGAIRIEVPAQRAYLMKDSHKTNLALTPIEFKILYHLMAHEGEVASRQQLFVAVWGENTHVFDRATDKHVSSLRHKLGEVARSIETVSGVGYRFTLSPRGT